MKLETWKKQIVDQINNERIKHPILLFLLQYVNLCEANKSMSSEVKRLRQMQFGKKVGDRREKRAPPPSPSKSDGVDEDEEDVKKPNPKVPRVSKPKGKAKARCDKSRTTEDSDADDDDDDCEANSLHASESEDERPQTKPIPSTEGAADARLRRLCERKPSGKCHVTEEVHQQWLRGGASRKKLLKELESVDFNKDWV